jgi:diguanylate cyclase (GGDEF)-like protein
MRVCWYCEAQTTEDAAFCARCGHSLQDRASSPLFVVDAVTGLFNGVFVQAMVDQESNRAMRYKRPLSVLVVEVDHADDIHRDLGAQQLNQLLKELAEVLVSSVRDTDTVGVLDVEGAPRFAVLLPETEQEGALLAADKIRRAIASHDFMAGGQWQRLTLSCGASTVNHERMAKQDLIQQASEALESGRASGQTNRTHASAQL